MLYHICDWFREINHFVLDNFYIEVKMMKKRLLVLGLLAAITANAADTTHQHDEKVEHIGAHVHGVAALNIVLEGDDLDVMLESPAMNVVGFEHKPVSDEHFEQSHKALHTLKDIEWLVIDKGGCKVNEAEVAWQYASMVHERFHNENGEEHKHEEHKHEEHKHEEHEHDHAGHDHQDGGEHSDIDAKFEFHCQSPASVEVITVNLFDAFPRFEKLNVQWIVNDKQGASVLTPSSRQIVLDK